MCCEFQLQSLGTCALADTFTLPNGILTSSRFNKHPVCICSLLASASALLSQTLLPPFTRPPLLSCSALFSISPFGVSSSFLCLLLFRQPSYLVLFSACFSPAHG